MVQYRLIKLKIGIMCRQMFERIIYRTRTAAVSIAAIAVCCTVNAGTAGKTAFADESEYRPLVISKGELRPFAEQHDIYAFALPWFDPAGRDIVSEGSCFGSKPLLYRFLRMERDVPVYASGVPYSGPSPRNAAPWHGRNGEFGICRIEKNALVLYRFDRSTRTFGKKVNISGGGGASKCQYCVCRR